MADTQLKREFKERDVARLRNIITKKYGNATGIQVGYEKQSEDHVEGDVWEESDKTWTIKDGIKQTVTKLDAIKKASRMPIVCPSCKKSMKTSLDKKMYPIHSKCFNCVVETESQMKLDGTYEEYMRNIINKNLVTHIEEAEKFIEEFVNTNKESYVTEQGDVEDWSGGVDKNKMAEEWKKELEEMRELISK